MKYYVYAYIRNNGTPYYIGKGCGKRAFAKNRNPKPPKDISKIILCETNLTEIGAYAIERRLIKWHGRKIDNTGILNNITEGGPGTHGFSYNRKQKTKIKLSKNKKGMKWFYNKNNLKEIMCKVKPKGDEWTKGRSPKTKHGGRRGEYSKQRYEKIANANRGKPAPNKGKSHRNATIEKIKAKAQERPETCCIYCKRIIKGNSNLLQHQRSKHCTKNNLD